MELVRFAAARTLHLAEPGSAEHTRARTYEAAALVVTGEFEKGFAALEGIDRTALQGEDAELLDAALSVAESIRTLPRASGPPGPAPEGAIASPTVQAARQMVARVDRILDQKTR